MASHTKTKKKAGPQEYCKKDFLAVLGTANSMTQAPFNDDKFEIWGVSPVVTYEACKRVDVLFELHKKGYWDREDIRKRLQSVDKPLYMHEKYEQFPASLRYPVEDVVQYSKYHTTSISFMLALAYHSFKTTGKPYHVALYGVHMDHDEEYDKQRPCVEYWVGMMEGAGIDVSIAPGGSLLATHGLYGYENYNPICYDLKARIKGLQAGAQHCEAQRNEAEGNRHQQIGAVKEAQYWLERFQKGDVPTDDKAPAHTPGIAQDTAGAGMLAPPVKAGV